MWITIVFLGCGRIGFETVNTDSGTDAPQEDLPEEDASEDVHQLDSGLFDSDSSTSQSNPDSRTPRDATSQFVDHPDSESSSQDSEASMVDEQSCSDEITNGLETDVDCGGSQCPPCERGKDCDRDEDCLSEVCNSGVCEAVSCRDGVMNQDEEDIDCGGTSCPACPSCNDEIRNQDEEGVDCGGVCDPCPCSPRTFGEPEPITGLGLSGDLYGPSLSLDGSTIFLAENDGSDEDIKVAIRSGRGNAFSTATEVPNINSPHFDGTPFITYDGLTIYFYTERPGGQGIRDIMLASRSSVGDSFSSPVWLNEVNTEATEQLPRLTQDELVFLFDSDRPGGKGDLDLWKAERDDRSETFSSVTNLSELNSPNRDTGASLSSDGLTIYFSSNRPDGEGEYDIWFATRTYTESQFSSPENLTIVNSPGWELDPFITADGNELFFSTNRSGKFQIWRAERHCLSE